MAFDDSRFEEVLGSLSRRLVGPDEVARTVTDLLRVPAVPMLDQHDTILRLSRDSHGRISVVTTNFDTLLERSAKNAVSDDEFRNISFAGQALPLPGSALFSGIIHIHGRIADSALGLEGTPLVLTSADYGDAYMRSGWVSRFLFDLARCKTIVLVGYSANDAPVRYILNVLEADRARFPDLKPIYALSEYRSDPTEAEKAWGTLAVTPLRYCCRKTPESVDDHSPLWRDLERLARIVESPRKWRQDRTRTILMGCASQSDDNVRSELRWLSDAATIFWPAALESIYDPKWFNLFENENLWSRKDATWVIAAWVAQKLEDSTRFQVACEWQPHLGQPFIAEIEQWLYSKDKLSETWTRLWRLFCLTKPHIHGSYIERVKRRVVSQVVLDRDLESAVGILVPRLRLIPDRYPTPKIDYTGSPKRLSDLVDWRMEVPHRDVAEGLIQPLCSLQDRTGRLLDLATFQLQSSLECEADLGRIGDDFDFNDFNVPSIEEHAQNRHRDGVNLLVQLLVELLPVAVAQDRCRTRRLVARWPSMMPGRTGLRLCLHAMRSAAIFDADEAMRALLSTSEVDFWSIDREGPLLLRDRARGAATSLVGQVEARIRAGCEEYYRRYTIAPGELDWRKSAADSKVWIRLKMLEHASKLTSVGRETLSAIESRREYLSRPVGDRDFFSSYVSEPRFVVGDPKPISGAAGVDRLRIARDLRDSVDVEQRMGWSAYCVSDPQGAFGSLAGDDLDHKTGPLWNDFIGGLLVGDELSKPIREDLAIKTFDHWHHADADTLQLVASSLTSLLLFGPRDRVSDVAAWIERLWNAVPAQPKETSPHIMAYTRRHSILRPGKLPRPRISDSGQGG